jgi:hypothetical protein
MWNTVIVRPRVLRDIELFILSTKTTIAYFPAGCSCMSVAGGERVILPGWSAAVGTDV